MMPRLLLERSGLMVTGGALLLTFVCGCGSVPKLDGDAKVGVSKTTTDTMSRTVMPTDPTAKVTITHNPDGSVSETVDKGGISEVTTMTSTSGAGLNVGVTTGK